MIPVSMAKNSKEDVFKLIHDVGNYLQLAQYISYQALQGVPNEDEDLLRGRKFLELIHYLLKELAESQPGELAFTQYLDHLMESLQQVKGLFGGIKPLVAIVGRLEALLKIYTSPDEGPSVLALRDVVQATVEALRPAFELKRISLYACLPAPDVMVSINRTQFSRVLENLMFNALKYTECGGVVWLEASSAAEGVCVSISDSGKGIDPADQPFIFEEFYQADRSQPGMGLGLAIARETIHRYGGELVVESEGVGWGATFRLFLPVLAGNSRDRALLQFA